MLDLLRIYWELARLLVQGLTGRDFDLDLE